jgi:hypothetical protein
VDNNIAPDAEPEREQRVIDNSPIMTIPRMTNAPLIRGLAQNYEFFLMPPKSFLSVPIYSIRCEYDILKVSLKKNDQNLSVGGIKHANAGFRLV